MGHALNNSIQDCLIRYHRMRGRRTKWILGTDHAGIATQTQVERELDPRGHQPRGDRPRGVRSSACWEWRERYGGTIIEQLKRLGASCDYDDERFTLDEAYAEAVLQRVRRAVREGLHLPRPLHGQLGSGQRLGDLRPRGRAARRRPTRCTTSTTRSASGSGSITVATVRPGDDAGRHRDRGATPTTTATAGSIGETAILPLVGPQAEDHRRRLRQARVRHRRAEDHARPRPQRLRDRPPARARAASVIGEDGRMTAEAPRALRAA